MKNYHSLTSFGLLAIFLLAVPYPARSEGMHDVPRKLFGLELGGVYDIGDPTNNDTGSMPVKKVCSIYSFLGAGFHYSFQPLIEYENFDYKEKIEHNSTTSSFSAYIFPIIPDNITTLDQIHKEKIKYEIASISWTNDDLSEEQAYYWAKGMCEIFSADIKVKPEIYDDFGYKAYECTFFDNERKFSATSVLKSVRLEYIKTIFDKKNDDIDKKMLRIMAHKIRPYE